MKYQNFIKSPENIDGAALAFRKSFTVDEDIKAATLKVSSLGIYRAMINGKKIGEQVLAPGYTSYDNRIQYATYDITKDIKNGNVLDITVGPGWAIGHYGLKGANKLFGDAVLAVCELCLEFSDGRVEYIVTDSSWDVYTTEVTYADLYVGETVDKTVEERYLGKALASEKSFNLIPQEGADIIENDVLAPIELIITPKGERVLDFGQNMTGYVSLKIRGNRGERVVLSHGEVLDAEGNFYNANYRSAKSILTFVLSGEEDSFKPEFSFQGFRYVRIDEYPDGKEIDLNGFRAIVVHSKMERTAYFTCGNAKINQLYHNIIWGNKGNFLDVPTDCPQRDERLGWTGDAQVFCRTAATNFDVRVFFKKWLGDLRAEQREDGAVKGVCPEKFLGGYATRISAGWGDVATIVPWTLYEVYDDKTYLSDNFEMMKRWVEYIRQTGDEEYLWLSGYHYGDWLAMDAGEDSYVGATSNDLIATVFYAYSTELLVKAGEVLGKDVSEYKTLLANIKRRFREYFMENGMPKEELPFTEKILEGRTSVIDTVRKGMTQTALVLILYFDLCLPEEREAIADKLEELIRDFDGRMTTGFLGTPYILHALSACGRDDTAYGLFFQDKNPSWLYSVNKGATTIWEHWNGIKDDGSFWSTDMNSFNHYAYGCVAEWMYGTIAGIKLVEVGYKKIRIAPVPNKELGFVKCRLDTVSGRIESHWYYSGDRICFEFSVPNGVEAQICLPNGYTENVCGGQYFYSVKI